MRPPPSHHCGILHFPWQQSRRLRRRTESFPGTSGRAGADMTTGRICCLVLLTLGVLAVVVVLLVTLTQPKCAPQQYLHGAVAADTETCSNIGRYVHAPLGLSVWTVCAVGLGWWTGNTQSFCPISAPGAEERCCSLGARCWQQSSSQN